MVALFSILFLPGARSEPPASSPPVTLIRCGTLIDGVSAVPRKDVLLRVEGNRIASLSTNRRAFSHESSARTIDLSTATCLSGLIDVHVHFINQDAHRRELQTPSESLSAENLLSLKPTVWAMVWSDRCAELCDGRRIRPRSRATPPDSQGRQTQCKREDTTPERLVALAISAAYMPLDEYIRGSLYTA
jgi:hypothetical protein